jgi:hypothetical protein
MPTRILYKNHWIKPPAIDGTPDFTTVIITTGPFSYFSKNAGSFIASMPSP